jgi:hypothetical protein
MGLKADGWLPGFEFEGSFELRVLGLFPGLTWLVVVKVTEQKVVEAVSILRVRGMAIAWEDLKAHPRYQMLGLDGFFQGIVRVTAAPYYEGGYLEGGELVQASPVFVLAIFCEESGIGLPSSHDLADSPGCGAKESPPPGQSGKANRIDKDKPADFFRVLEGDLQTYPATDGMSYEGH